MLFPVIKDTRSTSGIVDLVTNVDYVPLVNHYLEQRSYPAPAQEQEEEAPKKARTRVPQEKSLKERGTGSTPSRTEAAEQKPSVKKRLEYLKSVTEQTRTGPEKIKEKTR